MSHAFGLDRSRYARYGGWRRHEGLPYQAQFGYGGANFGGFGRKGKFGGYRSHYDYSYDNPYRKGYWFEPVNTANVDMSYEAASYKNIAQHHPTFWFAMILLLAIILGIWYR